MKLLGVIDKSRHQFILDGVKHGFCVKCGWNKETISASNIYPCVRAYKRESIKIDLNIRHNLVYYSNRVCECGFLRNFYNCTKCHCIFNTCRACSIFDGSYVSWIDGKTSKEDIPIIIKRGTDIEMPCRLSDDDISVADIIL